MRREAAKRQTKPLPVRIGDEVLNVVYFPNKYTPKHEKAAREAADGKDSTAGDMLGKMLVPLISSWDLTDVRQVDDGSGGLKDEEYPVPVSEEGFEETPLSILLAVQSAINDDLMPGKQTSSSSEGSF